MHIKTETMWLAALAVLLYLFQREYGRRRLRALTDMSNADFVKIIQGIGDFGEATIIEARRWVSKIFWIPLAKVSPDLTLKRIREVTDYFGSHSLSLEEMDAQIEKVCKETSSAKPSPESLMAVRDLVLFYLKAKQDK